MHTNSKVTPQLGLHEMVFYCDQKNRWLGSGSAVPRFPKEPQGTLKEPSPAGFPEEPSLVGLPKEPSLAGFPKEPFSNPQIQKNASALLVARKLPLACLVVKKSFALHCFDLHCLTLHCFALLCFDLLCFALICFASLCFASGNLGGASGEPALWG